MNKLKSFFIPDDPMELGRFQKQIQEKKSKIRISFATKIPEVQIEKYFHFLEGTKKGFRIVLQDENQYCSWDDSCYITVLNMTLDAGHIGINKVNFAFESKFASDPSEVSINYITAILRSEIKNTKRMLNFIEPDLLNIRNLVESNKENKPYLLSCIPQEFIKLNLKINNSNLDSETKKSLSEKVSKEHREFQEWIQKK